MISPEITGKEHNRNLPELPTWMMFDADRSAIDKICRLLTKRLPDSLVNLKYYKSQYSTGWEMKYALSGSSLYS